MAVLSDMALGMAGKGGAVSQEAGGPPSCVHHRAAHHRAEGRGRAVRRGALSPDSQASMVLPAHTAARGRLPPRDRKLDRRSFDVLVVKGYGHEPGPWIDAGYRRTSRPGQ